MEDVKELSNNYNELLNNIGFVLEQGRKSAFIAINSVLINTYWEIGKNIVEFEQKGNEKAEYGSKLLDTLARDLKDKYGKGFSKSNVYLMRLFYIKYPIFQTLSGKLSWSHYIEILSIEDDLERGFYEKQCEKENWSVRELKRQINSALFHRIALSKDKKGVIELSQKGQIIEKPQDLIKDPYVLEFLKLPEMGRYSERDLEQKIIDNLHAFLLELGKGFAFVSRQFRISLGGEHFFVDLVFYNISLKCFILIDLKIGKATHQDVGQMNLYLNYFKKEEMKKGDNEPIGIILSAHKNDLTVEYALGSISNKLFVSKYKTYMPDKKELENKIKEIIEENEEEKK